MFMSEGITVDGAHQERGSPWIPSGKGGSNPKPRSMVNSTEIEIEERGNRVKDYLTLAVHLAQVPQQAATASPAAAGSRILAPMSGERHCCRLAAPVLALLGPVGGPHAAPRATAGRLTREPRPNFKLNEHNHDHWLEKGPAAAAIARDRCPTHAATLHCQAPPP